MSRNEMQPKGKHLRFTIFFLVQMLLFTAIAFGLGGNLGRRWDWMGWIIVFLFILSVSAGAVGLGACNERGVTAGRLLLSTLLWWGIATLAWFILSFIAANIIDSGFAPAGILFSLPLGLASACLLGALDLIPTKKR